MSVKAAGVFLQLLLQLLKRLEEAEEEEGVNLR